MFNKIVSYLPVFSAFALVVACIKIFLYYHNFQVPINQYIGISELVTAVAGDLLFVVPFVITYSILGYHSEIKIDTINERIETGEKENIIRRQKMIGLLVQVGLFICIAYFFFTTSRFVNKIQIAAVMVLFIYSFYSRYAKNKDKDYLKREMNRALGFSAIFIFSWFLVAGVEIRNVEAGKYLGTKIITKDSTYASTKEHFFIGKTEKYVFIYNAIDTTTTVLKVDNIESVILKER